MTSLLIDTNIVIDLLAKRVEFYEEAREILRKFKVLVGILSLDDKITELALSDDDFPDFEDGLQYYSAVENRIDVIITRNKKDFKNSKILVLTAKEFLPDGSPKDKIFLERTALPAYLTFDKTIRMGNS